MINEGLWLRLAGSKRQQINTEGGAQPDIQERKQLKGVITVPAFYYNKSWTACICVQLK